MGGVLLVVAAKQNDRQIADSHTFLIRVSPYLLGEKGDAFKQRVWAEILDSLRKDVPEVLEIARPKVA